MFSHAPRMRQMGCGASGSRGSDSGALAPSARPMMSPALLMVSGASRLASCTLLSARVNSNLAVFETGVIATSEKLAGHAVTVSRRAVP